MTGQSDNDLQASFEVLLAQVLTTDEKAQEHEAMKKIADGDVWSTPATIDDPMVLTEIGDVLRARGLVGARDGA